MEKLIKKFESFYYSKRTLGVPIEEVFRHSKVAELVTEETKKLALAFANYQEHAQYDIEDKYLTQEQLFEQFIDEYYE
ncbi:MAG TPA: hypothetical protein PLG47_05740 [Candidatus Dojkabacteria bacterium]|nr:hypothetical protein [Candidatus Dojkabacteria bacterium]